MQGQRHFTGIGKETGVNDQNIQHFMSNSPWSGETVCEQVRAELKETEGLQQGGMLLIDESADEKTGTGSAGAARQYNGRLGKVDVSQVGVMLSYVNLHVPQGLWTWIDGDLFLPEAWFNESHESKRKLLGIPEDLKFKTKPELALDLIKRAKSEGMLFEAVGFDSLYGRNIELRANLRTEQIIYVGDVPFNTLVYTSKPVLGIPEQRESREKKPSKIQVLDQEAVRIDNLHEKLKWKNLNIRTTDRGELHAPFACCRVWTVYDGEPVEEWLIMRRETPRKISYSLSNAPSDTSLEQLAFWKCQRYFIERSNQDAKSELGWHELQARKYRAWKHHLSLTILASWFIAQAKNEWALTHQRDPELPKALGVDELPALSMANLRELLRAVMPLKQLTVEQATEQVITHLTNRVRSRKSRLKKHKNYVISDGCGTT